MKPDLVGVDLLNLQLALECKGFNRAGDVVRVEGDEPDDISPVALVQVDGDHRLLVRADLPDAVRAALRRLPLAETFETPAEIVTILAERMPEVSWRRLRSGVLRQTPDVTDRDGVVVLGSAGVPRLERFFEAGFALYAARRPVFAVMDRDRVVAACTSSRENEHAAEAWVVTEPESRRRGLARRCAAAWASSVLESGKVAFYSHDDSNAGSRAVAEALGVEYWLSAVVVDAD